MPVSVLIYRDEAGMISLARAVVAEPRNCFTKIFMDMPVSGKEYLFDAREPVKNRT